LALARRCPRRRFQRTPGRKRGNHRGLLRLCYETERQGVRRTVAQSRPASGAISVRAKGMVTLGGKTYRIVKVRPSTYDVIRILDDARMGQFESKPRLRVEPDKGEEKLLVEIAFAALKGAKVSWAAPIRRK